jgi:preprotein translocase SecE subunit
MSLTDYLKETRVELTHVNWPSRKQSLAFTFVVIFISIAVAFFLGFFDFLFSKILARFIG